MFLGRSVLMQTINKQVAHRFLVENCGLLAVILISIVFITIRLAMPIKFDGSYIDEYWHITSGISLFESANYAYFYNNGSPTREGY